MKRNISLLLIAMACLAGCSIDDLGKPDGSSGGTDDITFVISLPSGASGPQSYAGDESTIDDSKVNKVDVFAFRNESGTYYYVENQRGTNITSTDLLEKTFTARFAKLEESKSYCFVVLANARAQVDAKAYAATDKMDDIMAQFQVQHTGVWDITQQSIPMWGKSKDVVMAAKNMEVDKFSILRMLAKINVTVEGDADDVFTLESVRVYNYRDRGYLVPDKDNFVAGTITRVAKPTVLGDRITTISKPLVYEGITGNQCLNMIYTFETDSVITGGKLDEDLSHCLVIGGKYDTDAKATYYKVYFKRLTEGVTTYPSLLRNHRYAVTITQVYSSGYETPEDAMEAQDVDFSDVIVIEWDGVDMGDTTLDGIDGESQRVGADGSPINDWEGKGDDIDVPAEGESNE